MPFAGSTALHAPALAERLAPAEIEAALCHGLQAQLLELATRCEDDSPYVPSDDVL